MAYQIRKGWPGTEVIDQVLLPDAAGLAKDGMFVKVVNGQCKVEAFSGSEAADDPLYAFIIGQETVSGNRTGLMSDCVIEMDADHYTSGVTYAANKPVTIGDSGKLKLATTEKAVGKILKWDATSKMLTVLFFGAH